MGVLGGSKHMLLNILYTLTINQIICIYFLKIIYVVTHEEYLKWFLIQQRPANFFCQGSGGKYFRFCNHTVSFAVLLLQFCCYCIAKAAIN